MTLEPVAPSCDDKSQMEVTMTEYRVTWEIDIEADTHEEAAREALRIQRDPDSIATVFDVMNAKHWKDRKTVDLSSKEQAMEDLLFKIRDWLDGICFGNEAADKQARELVTRLNEALRTNKQEKV